MNRHHFAAWALALAFVLSLPTAWADSSSAGSATGDNKKGFIFLSTRGFARTTSDDNNKNVEAETLHRQEFPYGAAPSWRFVYLGFSDGTNDAVNIKGAGVWIQQKPGDPIVRLPLTFNGGASHAVIQKDALQETDPISTEVKPGAVVWATTWYCSGTPTVGLPFQTLLCKRESKPGLEDYDGTAVGPIGSLPDLTLKGGFHHDDLSLTAGTPYCARGYRPIGAVGLPSPDFHGKEIVPLFLGDSINVQYIDVFDDNTIYSMRGFNGRFCANNYPYMVFGQGGSTSGGFTEYITSPLVVYILGDHGAHQRKVTHLFNEYGINSVRVHNPIGEIATFEWADRQRVATIAHSFGVPYIQSTLTPCVAGCTGWPSSSPSDKAGFANFVAGRQAFNNMVRTQSDDAHLPGCIGYWDPCQVVETDPKNGNNEWIKAYLCDGIHPNSAGHAAIAKAIPTSLVEDHPNPVPSQ